MKNKMKLKLFDEIIKERLLKQTKVDKYKYHLQLQY